MNNLQNKQPWYTSIGVIIFAMMFFWPVGCVLLYLRWAKKNGKYKTINKILLIAAIVLLLIGVVGMSAFFDNHDAASLFVALFMFIIPGLVCGYFWYKRNSKLKKYNRYLEYINARKRTKIDELCHRLNIDYDTATSALTEMINKGLINGYLDENELIMNGSNDVLNDYIEERIVKKKETKIIKCKECGAKNTVVIGEKNECEYCGSLLQ